MSSEKRNHLWNMRFNAPAVEQNPAALPTGGSGVAPPSIGRILKLEQRMDDLTKQVLTLGGQVTLLTSITSPRSRTRTDESEAQDE